MKADFNINVTIGLEERLYQVVESLLGMDGVGKACVKAISRELGKAGKAAMTVEVNAEPAPRIRVEGEPSAAETKAPAVTVEARRAEISPMDVRKAIRAAQVRIIGEDYDTNTSSENYIKYHKPLMSLFTMLAGTLEENTKPSLLHSQESRAAFIDQCGHIAVNPETDTPEVIASF